MQKNAVMSSRHVIGPSKVKRWLALLILPFVAVACAPKQQDTRAIVTDFARLFYTERDVKRAFETYVASNYIQHNPGVADGRDAAIAALGPMFADRTKSFTIKRILVDGDMAVIQIFVSPMPDSRGAAVFDMFRLKDGKILEHWDAIQPVPEKSANPHPMF